MIYSVTINNKAIIDGDYQLNLRQAYILAGLYKLSQQWIGISRIEFEGKMFFWFAYDMIAEQLPLLRCKRNKELKRTEKDGIYRTMKEMCEEGFIVAHPDNQKMGKSYYAFTENAIQICKNEAPPTSIYANKKPKNKKIGYIYFLFEADVLVYIGQTINLRSRMRNHSSSYKRFDSFAYIAPATSKELSLNKIESAYIKKYKPILNLNNYMLGDTNNVKINPYDLERMPLSDIKKLPM